ncbi:MAG: hypothetical protein AB7I19_00420 [Planctomycetota bacterium]
MSWFGLGLAVVHFGFTCVVWRRELRNRHNGFVNFNGVGTMMLSAPSWLTLGRLLRRLGVPMPRWHERGLAGHVEIGTHVVMTSVLVYFLGWSIESLVRAWFG